MVQGSSGNSSQFTSIAATTKSQNLDSQPKSELGSDGLNSLTWSQDIATGDPLLCVTGHDPKIKILNVRTGELVRVSSNNIQPAALGLV